MGAEIESTKGRIAEMKRKVDSGEEDEEVAKVRAVNVKLKYRISHLQTNLDEELEKDRRWAKMEGRDSF